MAYVKAALQEEQEFECSKPLDADLCEAIEWLGGEKTDQEVMDERESIMTVFLFSIITKPGFLSDLFVCRRSRNWVMR